MKEVRQTLSVIGAVGGCAELEVTKGGRATVEEATGLSTQSHRTAAGACDRQVDRAAQLGIHRECNAVFLICGDTETGELFISLNGRIVLTRKNERIDGDPASARILRQRAVGETFI